MQPSKPSYQAANNASSSPSQYSQDLSEILQLWQGYQQDYNELLSSLDVPSLGTEFSTLNSTQLSGENPLFAQTEDDDRKSEPLTHDQFNAATTTPELSTPDNNHQGSLTPATSDPNETIGGFADVWETDFSPYSQSLDELIPPTGTLSDYNEPGYPIALSIQSSSVAEEEHHGNDVCHGDQPSPSPNSVEVMTNWRRQAQEPCFRINVSSPPNSPSENPTRRRRSSSKQGTTRLKRQRSSKEGSQSLLSVDRFGHNCDNVNDFGSVNQSIGRNHSQIRTAPSAIAVGDLFHYSTQNHELPTRKKRARSLSQEGLYPCPICRRCFKRERDIPRHIETVHEEKKYICEYCGKSYTRDDSRKRHYPNCTKKPEDKDI